MNKYYNYISTYIKINFTKLKEYKFNLYLGIYANIMFSITACLFYFVLNNTISTLIPWEMKEWVFFYINFELIILFFQSFLINTNLKKELINGEFNNYIAKPIDVFIQYLMKNIFVFLIFLSFLYLILFIIYLVYFWEYIILYKLILTFILSFLGGIFFLITNYYIDSFAFYFKDISTLMKSFVEMRRGVEKYPVIIFNGNVLIFLSFFGITYIGGFATHYLFGHFDNFQLLIIILQLVTLNFILGFGIYLNWKFGFKKYEGYN